MFGASAGSRPPAPTPVCWIRIGGSSPNSSASEASSAAPVGVVIWYGAGRRRQVHPPRPVEPVLRDPAQESHRADRVPGARRPAKSSTRSGDQAQAPPKRPPLRRCPRSHQARPPRGSARRPAQPHAPQPQPEPTEQTHPTPNPAPPQPAQPPQSAAAPQPKSAYARPSCLQHAHARAPPRPRALPWPCQPASPSRECPSPSSRAEGRGPSGTFSGCSSPADPH